MKRTYYTAEHVLGRNVWLAAGITRSSAVAFNCTAARLQRIYGGTNEIMKVITGRDLVGRK